VHEGRWCSARRCCLTPPPRKGAARTWLVFFSFMISCDAVRTSWGFSLKTRFLAKKLMCMEPVFS